MFNIRNNKAFTIIELIVVIAIIGILILFGVPKFIGYAQKAQLARIQHDTRVMEEAMEHEFLDGITRQWNEWDTNYKNLFNIVARKQLFETEGVARRVDMSYMYYNPFMSANLEVNRNSVAALNSELIEPKVDVNLQLKGNVGGRLIQVGDNEDAVYEKASPHTDYRVVPDKFKSLIGTKLKGSFYVNALGKVYYEPDKPLTIDTSDEELKPNCSIALPDYEFDHTTGTITKYLGDEKHVVIPSTFLVNGECVLVKVIGKGAFMQGDYKSIVVPEGVIIFEEDAIKGDDLDKVIIKGPEGSVEIYPGAIENTSPGGGGGKPIIPEYNPPIYDDIIIKPERDESGNIIGGTIISGGSGIPTTSVPGGSFNGIVVIPEYVNVNEERVPVTGIAPGAYQGLGLISVVLPEGLERIEAYAFSGNQLIGITIPNSVYYIGHYAFSFNEAVNIDKVHGPKRIATIKTIIMKNVEQFYKLDRYGDILEDGIKLNNLVVGDGIDINLNNHIFVTSIGHIVIDEEYIGDELPVDKSLLIQTLEEAELLNKDDYKLDDKWRKLQSTMIYAEKVINHPDVKQGQVNQATRNLINAMKYLNNIVIVDKTKLIATIEEAQGLEQGDYINWDRLISILNSAIQMRDNKNSTQAQVDSIETLLRITINNLSEVDKKELIELISEAELLEQSDYREGWDFLSRNLALAIRTRDDKNSTQALINKVIKDLQKAINELISIPNQFSYEFIGEILTSELITGDKLANDIGLIKGTAQYSNEAWLKFIKTDTNGIFTVLYVAKKPYRHSVSWNNINEVGAVFGDKLKTQELSINGNRYKVRLIEGSSIDPTNNIGKDLWGSEWNKMLLPIHEDAIDLNWDYPNNVEPNIISLNHSNGTGKDGRYTDDDLALINTHRGSYSWTQGIYKSNPVVRQIRGYDGVSFSGGTAYDKPGSDYGWRPVLELLK